MRIRIEGRYPLRGTYHVSGNSNAAMALIAASMLTAEPITLSNVPDVVSVGVMLEIGQSFGLENDQRENSVSLQTPHLIGRALDRE
jgi:UDP-N-acetylglucosamine 1-carboxyvinyltransferase